MGFRDQRSRLSGWPAPSHLVGADMLPAGLCCFDLSLPVGSTAALGEESCRASLSIHLSVWQFVRVCTGSSLGSWEVTVWHLGAGTGGRGPDCIGALRAAGLLCFLILCDLWECSTGQWVRIDSDQPTSPKKMEGDCWLPDGPSQVNDQGNVLVLSLSTDKGTLSVEIAEKKKHGTHGKWLCVEGHLCTTNPFNKYLLKLH